MNLFFILLTSCFTLFFSIKNLNAQVVSFYDPNFRACLVNDPAINTNGDGLIQLSEAVAYNGVIDCSYRNISNLGGIEAFVNLTGLSCVSNQLTSLNISQNTNLTSLNCFLNNLTSLDISQNTNLTYLDCSLNNITSLNPSQNINLTDLRCRSNNITSLDVTQNASLVSLDCSSNSLSNLDITQNTNLEYLYCSSNNLNTLDVTQNTSLKRLNYGLNNLNILDVSQNTILEYLHCHSNQLNSLDVTQNTSLTHLYCHSNQLSSLDLSQNASLIILHCYSNELSSLDIKNGNNINIDGTYFNTTSNPNLTCIEVDDSTYSANNWTNIDPTASFSTNCGIFSNITSIGETINATAYPNPTAKDITLDLGRTYQEATIQVMNLTGQAVLNKTLVNTSTTTLELNGAVGVYFVTIRTQEGTAVLRIVKE